MRWKPLLLTLTLSLNLALTTSLNALAAPDVQTVVAEGEAAIGNNASRAREEAIAQANRMAVEQAMGVYVVSETLVENMALVRDTILTKSSGYISGYKIISESKANGILKVKVEATISVLPLVDQLAKMGLLRDWTVAVVLVSNAGERASNEAAKTRLNQTMIDKGFKLADNQALVALNQPEILEQIQKGNHMAALPVLRDQGVDVLVVGTTLTRATEDGVIETYGGVKTVMTQGRIDARVVRVDTGEILASKSFQAVAGGSSVDMAESKAIDQAAGKAGDFFALEIAKLPAASTAMVQLIVKGLVFNRERAFRDALQRIQGLSKVNRSIYRNQLANYEIEFKGKADDLAEALADAPSLKPFKFDIQSVSSGSIEATAK
ncbi:MAG: hypothetical protein CVV27_06195 [Candidatus Melainabacteria bacterium HGW-Melainabacteria-1]|nr:MAG: hypothetical protein CVV27_06195 [Candidatus Melainabacteria bacterium HGW-Melainabacteria-1]